MKIGITERGDASLDYTWLNKLNTVDGAVLITKNLTDKFIDTVMSVKHKVIIHATCTGWGATPVEPNVPDYKHQLSQVQKLLDKGFPVDQIIIRVDPIIPTEKGLARAQAVINESPIKHFRFSFMDMYPHVYKRFVEAGMTPSYNTKSIPVDMLPTIIKWFEDQPADYIFESCAEPQLMNVKNIKSTGCINTDILDILNIVPDEPIINSGYQRTHCHCLSCKTELLENKKRCPHGCLYCYWYDSYK